MLARSLPYAPAGVHLAVVDPEVGARRRAVALLTAEEDRLLVGPDNGLLLPAADRFGGVVEAVEISASPWRLEPVSATFHGRDVFAPVAARLAAGEPLGEAGAPVEPDELVRLELTRAQRRRRRAGGARGRRPTASATSRSTRACATSRAPTSGSGTRSPSAATRAARPACSRARSPTSRRGGLLLYEDAGGSLAVAINGGDAGRAARRAAAATSCAWSGREPPRAAAAAPALDRLDQRRARASSPRPARRTAPP